MSETEKVTVNVNVVDLGKIDLLSDEGFYSNRTDFIKTAIRNQLSQHSSEITATVVRKSSTVGIIKYGKRDLEKYLNKNEQLDIKIVGLLIIQDDVSEELVSKAIKSVKVFGSILADKKIKEILEQKGVS